MQSGRSSPADRPLTASARKSSIRPSVTFTLSCTVRPLTPGVPSISAARRDRVCRELRVHRIQVGIAIRAVHHRLEPRRQRHRLVLNLSRKSGCSSHPSPDPLELSAELTRRGEDARDPFDRREVRLLEAVFAVERRPTRVVSRFHGPNRPSVLISPRGRGLVSSASNGIRSSTPTPDIVSRWMANSRGRFPSRRGINLRRRRSNSSCSTKSATTDRRIGPAAVPPRRLETRAARRDVDLEPLDHDGAESARPADQPEHAAGNREAADLHQRRHVGPALEPDDEP